MRIEIATFAGGCFWCFEGIFKRLKGVVSVESGYSGGNVENPTYQDVCSGQTGHAETVSITFDPDIISFEKLLSIFWYLHDPTTLNQQGNDTGTQYRSAIFYHTQEQKKLAEESKANVEKEGMYKDPVVTEIVPFKNFYKAEDYHQQYYDKNQSAPYCKFVIDPKINKLIKEFSEDVKEEYKKDLG